jgi:hypothetical protein
VTTPEPTQPLTDEELDAMREGYEMAKGISADLLRVDTRDAIRLVAEIDRLRAENTAQAERLAAIRELRRTWFQNAEAHRGKADSMKGLTEVERAELRQGAAEMGYCAREIGLALGPTPEEQPDFMEKDLDRVHRALGVGDSGDQTDG